jgi:hypothetical protein
MSKVPIRRNIAGTKAGALPAVKIFIEAMSPRHDAGRKTLGNFH